MTSVKENPKKDNQKNSGLKKCFTALVDRKQVNLDLEVLRLILKHELCISVDTIDQDLSAILPFMLVFYVKNWPGWSKSHEYYSGKLNFKDWFEKFRHYIVLRLNYLMKNEYNNAIKSIMEDRNKELGKNPNRSFKNQGAQTDYLAPKDFAPFAITITSSPILLGSLNFAENGDHIILRRHAGLPWIKISFRELLNWPFVTVEFTSPELSIRRRNCGEYTRYLNLNRPLTMETNDFIEQVEIIDPSCGRSCYTVDMLRSYSKEYIQILKSVKDADYQTVKNIEMFLDEFLTDVYEIEMNNTMATNTSVVFNIGKRVYVRNRKCPQKSKYGFYGSQTVNFVEQFIPKLELSLNYFKAVQDMSMPEVSFSYLNIVNTSIVYNNSLQQLGPAMPVLTYRCNFCDEVFKTDQLIMTHLEQQHKMEPSFMCIKCNKSFSVRQLASLRWKHLCIGETTYNKPTLTGDGSSKT